MNDSWTFMPLLLVLLLAFLVPVLLTRLKWMPVIVGEILAGILIGRSGIGLVGEDITLEFLAEIGLAILMFLAGLEVDFSVLSRPARGAGGRARTLIGVTAAFLGTLALAAAVSVRFVERGLGGDVVMLTLILSTTSLGVVVPVLKDRGLGGTPFGQGVLLSALLADFCTMFLITVYVAVRSRGLSLDLLLVGVLFVAALFAYRIGSARRRKPALPGLLREISSSASHLKIHGSIALLMGFVVLSKSLGTEMILGAFLAGAVLSLLGVSGDEDTRPGLEAIGFGFFIPLFFITVGMRFDFGALARNPAAALLVPGLLAAALAVKILPALFLRLSFTWRETFGAGILLSARLSLIIAASGIGLRLGLIDPAANAAVIVVAAVTSTLAPIGFGFLAPRAPGRKQSPIILFGTGDLSLQVARELAGRGETPVMLGPVAEAWAKDVDPRSWAARFDPRHVRSFMALSPSDDENLLAGREAVSAGVPHVIAAVNNPSRLPEYLAAGVRPVVHGVAQAALLALIAENPVFVGQLMAGHAAFQVQEHVLENPALAGRPLKDVALGPDLLLLSISREGEMLIPHGNTVLQAGDQLTLLGSGPALESIATRLSGTDR